MTKSVLTPDILLLESQDEILVLNVWLLLSLQSCRQTARQENDYFGKFKHFSSDALSRLIKQNSAGTSCEKSWLGDVNQK